MCYNTRHLMKFEYVYKTPDGVRHVETMEASSREAVFAHLRTQGIKAIKVVALDGTKANGAVKIVGIKKRMVFALILVAVFVTVGLTWFVKDEVGQPTAVTNPVPVKVSDPVTEATRRVATPLPRQMILGDRLRIRNAPTNLFAHVEEWHLAGFAEPGRKGGIISASIFSTNLVEVMKMLSAPIYTTEREFTEYVDLKRMTAGIKREMRDYIRGGHTVAEYLDELVKRQQLEISYYEKAEKKLQSMVDDKVVEKKALYNFWLKTNAQLQAMGIYPLPMPDSLRAYQMTLDFDE